MRKHFQGKEEGRGESVFWKAQFNGSWTDTVQCTAGTFYTEMMDDSP